jgi:hypothetical protein
MAERTDFPRAFARMTQPALRVVRYDSRMLNRTCAHYSAHYDQHGKLRDPGVHGDAWS